MDEDFLDINEGNSKKIFVILLFVIAALLALGYIFVYRPHHFGLNVITLEVGSTLSDDVNDYLKNKVIDTSLYKLDFSKVNTDEVGTYEYTVTINKNRQKGKIKVIDTTPPTFAIKENFQIEEGDEDFFIGDVMDKCEDVSLPCLITYKNDKDENLINVVGKHTFTIIVSDVYKNKKEAEITLEVLKKGSIVKEEELDLAFASSSSELPGFKDEYYIKLEKALNPNGEEVDNVANEISAETIENFVKTNYSSNTIKSTEIVSMYNKSGYIIGFAVKITLNNEKIVYLPKK